MSVQGCPGYYHDRHEKIGLVFFYVIQQLISIHAGHQKINDGSIYLVCRNDIERFLPVYCIKDLKSPRGEHYPHLGPHKTGVVYDQDYYLAVGRDTLYQLYCSKYHIVKMAFLGDIVYDNAEAKEMFAMFSVTVGGHDNDPYIFMYLQKRQKNFSLAVMKIKVK